VIDAHAPELADAEERPGLPALLAQLGSDARAFAEAEVRWIKAEAGERASHVVPALVLIVSALALAAGALIALLLGMILVLRPYAGTGGAVAIVVGGGIVVAGLLGWAGSRRIKRAVRPLNGQEEDK
jgi:Putative Actinobacterial Holin-X, holin superfamily III